MSLPRFTQHALSEWMKGKGPRSDIVISSRVRIARNLSGLPYPMLATSSQSSEVVRRVEMILREEGKPSVLEDAELIHMDDLSDLEKQVLVEKHLISPHLAEESRHGAVVLSPNEAVSIMVNEEDHPNPVSVSRFSAEELGSWPMNWMIGLNVSSPTHSVETKGYLTSCPLMWGREFGLR